MIPEFEAVSTDVRLDDPTTGFGSRDRLFDDLAKALEPNAPPSVLAVFGLEGIDRYRELFGRIGAEALLTELAGRLDRTRPGVTWYRPREDEFVALVGGPLPSAEALLKSAQAALDAPGEFVSVTAAVAAVVLPEEAGGPMEALMLADDQLSAHASARKARERRAQPR